MSISLTKVAFDILFTDEDLLNQELFLEVDINGSQKESQRLALSKLPTFDSPAIVENWAQEIDLDTNFPKGNIEVKFVFHYSVSDKPRHPETRKHYHPKFLSDGEVKYRLRKPSTDFLFYESAGFRKQEGYLVCNGATSQDSRHIIHLVSQAMRNVPELLPIPSDITTLFSTVHQQYAEEGVDTFLNEAKKLGEIANPKPKNKFDFDGPFGLYGWEVFFHIPALIASKYAENGDYDAAKRWMKCIYNPSAEGNPWGVLPLTLFCHFRQKIIRNA